MPTKNEVKRRDRTRMIGQKKDMGELPTKAEVHAELKAELARAEEKLAFYTEQQDEKRKNKMLEIISNIKQTIARQ